MPAQARPATGATSVRERDVEVPLPPGASGGGWHLLAGTLQRFGGDYDARLVIEADGGSRQAYALATSARGQLRELVRLPSGTLRAWVDPGNALNWQAAGLHIRRVGALQRHWQMWRRVLPLVWLHPAAKRNQAGVTVPRLLHDLPGAYADAARLRAHSAAPHYADWVRRFDTLDAADHAAIRRHLAAWSRPPAITVLLLDGPDDALQRSRDALHAQLFGNFQVLEQRADPAFAGLAELLGHASALAWVMVLRAGDVLPSHALYLFAWAALRYPAARVLYADEDELDAAGHRCRPQFKPAWSWPHARSIAFEGAAVMWQAQALAAAGGLPDLERWPGVHDAVLRVLDAAGGDAAHRIPRVLLHRASAPPPDAEAEAEAAAVRRHLARRGVAAQVQTEPGGTFRVRYLLAPEPPLVSIIVPTRDALELTRRCLDSLRRVTDYPHYEILLVDNQSRDPDALAWMQAQEGQGVRLLRHDAPFNYAAINNEAVRHARGELVCLLNNDTEAIHADWLREMVGQLLQPGVEVVGAKLLYPDGTVQHAGDVVGVGGIANHAFAWLPGDAPGYCRRAIVPQAYCAVTAACLLVRRDRYLALGGLDARHLPVAFNDVDFCLRVREAGGEVVWTPHARLLHHESVSRGRDESGARRRRAQREVAYMRRRWRDVLAADPYYHPGLHQERADFSLSPCPVLPRPWDR